MHLETLNGQPASILGLAGSQGMDTSCAAVAFEAGVNYFFFYDVSHENLLNGLKPIVATRREQVLMATGSEERDKGRLRQYLEQVRRYLDVDVVDVFFAEYVTPDEDVAQIWAILDELWDWKERGLIRYVGATTHNRASALDLIKSDRTEVLMHRYNMAHRKAEEQVFPMAQQAGIPVVAFTCNRYTGFGRCSDRLFSQQWIGCLTLFFVTLRRAIAAYYVSQRISASEILRTVERALFGKHPQPK